MSLQSVPLFAFEFLPSRPVEIEVSQAPLTSNAGLLPFRQLDQDLRLTEQFAAALDDHRDPALTQQSLLSMVRQRIYGILADYEDQNDHDTLRSDPVFKLIADRLPDDPDLASQPTLSRFENAVSIPDLWRLRDVLVDLFIQSFDAPPGHLTLDLDAFDDPAHGQQQLIMFRAAPLGLPRRHADQLPRREDAAEQGQGDARRQRDPLAGRHTARGLRLPAREPQRPGVGHRPVPGLHRQAERPHDRPEPG